MSFESYHEKVSAVTPILDPEELNEGFIVPENTREIANLIGDAVSDRFKSNKPAGERTPEALREAIIEAFHQIATAVKQEDGTHEEIDLNDVVQEIPAVSGDKNSKNKTEVWNGLLRFFNDYEIPYSVNVKNADLKIDLDPVPLQQVLADILVKSMGWDGKDLEEDDTPSFDDGYDDDIDGENQAEEGLENNF